MVNALIKIINSQVFYLLIFFSDKIEKKCTLQRKISLSYTKIYHSIFSYNKYLHFLNW